MSYTTLNCESEHRRQLVRQALLNGLDYLEVNPDGSLSVYFLGKAPQGLQKENVRIHGGRRIRDITVTNIRIYRQAAPDLDDYMIVTTDKRGDFATYTLCVVALDEQQRATDQPFPGFDPRYHCLDFSFMVDCPSDLDCLQPTACPPAARDEPEINYLAKDYASFRQLILDRLALVMPDWQERHVPDLGITLVEILAYTGDYLSYYQDAVATEAYLDTARQRISVRRHARLVDYLMHEGNNARAFLHIWTAADSELPPGQIAFITDITAIPGLQLPTDRLPTWDDLRDKVPKSRYEQFVPLLTRPEEAVPLFQAHNEIRFYTWGDEECCLPRGATTATLADGPPIPDSPQSPDSGEQYPADAKQSSKRSRKRPPKEAPEEAPPPSLDEQAEQSRVLRLQPGDVLIFEELLGPKTGVAADANPTHRHAVRLTQVSKGMDPLTRQPVLEITWEQADALPFPLCLSAVGPPPDCLLLEPVSVARGNIILVDHGRPVEEPTEGLWCVPTAETTICCEDKEQPSEVTRRPGRFQPRLKEGPLTFSEPYPASGPAAAMLRQDPRRAVPAIRLSSQLDEACAEPLTVDAPPAAEEPCDDDSAADNPPADNPLADNPPAVADAPPPIMWTARRDLLSSGPLDHHFVAELDNDGRAHLRFGNGELGRQPEAGASFQASYRVGVGAVGNVGAEAIRHAVANTTISGVEWRPRNPLPAQGGIDPEPIAAVKRFAPFTFRYRLERAITPEDYAAIVERDFAGEVQQAAAALRWTGSWYELLVAVDALGAAEPGADLLARIAAHLERYRRIGHDLRVSPAQHVPLDVALRVCVRPAYLRGHVKAALLQRFSNQTLPDGGKGFFHPDSLTFGAGIYLSHLVAAAQAVTGVQSVAVERLQRLYERPNQEIEQGVLALGPLEIARLDNDPSIPENGRLELIMEGGR